VVSIIVRRPDAAELLKIRRGEVNLDSLIAIAEQELIEMDKIFDESDLPRRVENLVNDLLVKIRREFYRLS
jgi:hypothetical protein